MATPKNPYAKPKHAKTNITVTNDSQDGRGKGKTNGAPTGSQSALKNKARQESQRPRVSFLPKRSN